MSDLDLKWGRRTGLPDGLEAAWGARMIWPADLLFDRQDIVGSDEQRKQLSDWLNRGALKVACARLIELAENGMEWHPGSEMEATLWSDDVGKVIASPQGSHGYVYVAAWLKAHIPPMMHRFADDHEAYDMSQTSDVIRDGDVLTTDDGYVGVLVGAWPVALTSERGCFHRLAEGTDWSDVNGRDYSRSVELARRFI